MVFVTFTTFQRSSQSPSRFSSEPVSQHVVKKGLQLVSVCLELAAIRSYLFKLLQAANKHRSRGKIKHWKRP